ncbi:hypothetical protein COBT_001558 [Conglomerata obtusa]
MKINHICYLLNLICSANDRSGSYCDCAKAEPHCVVYCLPKSVQDAKINPGISNQVNNVQNSQIANYSKNVQQDMKPNLNDYNYMSQQSQNGELNVGALRCNNIENKNMQFYPMSDKNCSNEGFNNISGLPTTIFKQNIKQQQPAILCTNTRTNDLANNLASNFMYVTEKQNNQNGVLNDIISKYVPQTANCTIKTGLGLAYDISQLANKKSKKSYINAHRSNTPYTRGELLTNIMANRILERQIDTKLECKEKNKNKLEDVCNFIKWLENYKGKIQKNAKDKYESIEKVKNMLFRMYNTNFDQCKAIKPTKNNENMNYLGGISFKKTTITTTYTPYITIMTTEFPKISFITITETITKTGLPETKYITLNHLPSTINVLQDYEDNFLFDVDDYVERNINYTTITSMSTYTPMITKIVTEYPLTSYLTTTESFIETPMITHIEHFYNKNISAPVTITSFKTIILSSANNNEISLASQNPVKNEQKNLFTDLSSEINETSKNIMRQSAATDINHKNSLYNSIIANTNSEDFTYQSTTANTKFENPMHHSIAAIINPETLHTSPNTESDTNILTPLIYASTLQSDNNNKNTNSEIISHYGDNPIQQNTPSTTVEQSPNSGNISHYGDIPTQQNTHSTTIEQSPSYTNTQSISLSILTVTITSRLQPVKTITKKLITTTTFSTKPNINKERTSIRSLSSALKENILSSISRQHSESIYASESAINLISSISSSIINSLSTIFDKEHDEQIDKLRTMLFEEINKRKSLEEKINENQNDVFFYQSKLNDLLTQTKKDKMNELVIEKQNNDGSNRLNKNDNDNSSDEKINNDKINKDVKNKNAKNDIDYRNNYYDKNSNDENHYAENNIDDSNNNADYIQGKKVQIPEVFTSVVLNTQSIQDRIYIEDEQTKNLSTTLSQTLSLLSTNSISSGLANFGPSSLPILSDSVYFFSSLVKNTNAISENTEAGLSKTSNIPNNSYVENKFFPYANEYITSPYNIVNNEKISSEVGFNNTPAITTDNEFFDEENGNTDSVLYVTKTITETETVHAIKNNVSLNLNGTNVTDTQNISSTVTLNKSNINLNGNKVSTSSSFLDDIKYKMNAILNIVDTDKTTKIIDSLERYNLNSSTNIDTKYSKDMNEETKTVTENATDKNNIFKTSIQKINDNNLKKVDENAEKDDIIYASIQKIKEEKRKTDETAKNENNFSSSIQKIKDNKIKPRKNDDEQKKSDENVEKENKFSSSIENISKITEDAKTKIEEIEKNNDDCENELKNELNSLIEILSVRNNNKYYSHKENTEKDNKKSSDNTKKEIKDTKTINKTINVTKTISKTVKAKNLEDKEESSEDNFLQKIFKKLGGNEESKQISKTKNHAKNRIDGSNTSTIKIITQTETNFSTTTILTTEKIPPKDESSASKNMTENKLSKSARKTKYITHIVYAQTSTPD